MDNASKQRSQQPGDSLSPSSSVTLPNRSVTESHGRREVSASSAVNAPSSAAHDDDEEDDDDYTSSSGSSLSSDDEEEDAQRGATDNENRVIDSNEGITSLPARRKPNIRRPDQESSLLSKLSAFLPQMKSANEDLQRDIAAGHAKDLQVDDENLNDQKDGQYIEMVCAFLRGQSRLLVQDC